MNTFFDYLDYMQQGGVPQQQMASPQQGGGNQQEQIMQIIQMYAQIAQVDPKQIMQQLQQMPPQKQQEALQQMVQAIQQASEEQGGGQEQMPMQRMGGQSSGGYSGTYDAATGSYFNYGGPYIPTYAEYAYGGGFTEIPGVFNQPVDRPNKAMYGMGMAKGGQMPQWLANRRFAAAGNQDKMSQYGYDDGGVVVGQEMNATPELLQQLKQGGYTFEYID